MKLNVSFNWSWEKVLFAFDSQFYLKVDKAETRKWIVLNTFLLVVKESHNMYLLGSVGDLETLNGLQEHSNETD